MCGVWGFITNEKGRGGYGRLKFTQQAALVGTLRGQDSAGAIVVSHGGEGPADWCKAVGSGEEFLNTKPAIERFDVNRMPGYRAILGHNRSATRGAINTANAHPFQEGPITLIHNGTLNSTGGLPTPQHTLKDKKVDVDSHAICHNLALHPAKEVLEALDGAYAILWHDARTQSIFATRNSQRPLYMMRLKDEDTVIFASESDMLWWLAGRNSMQRSTIYQLDQNVLLEFKDGSTKPVATRYTQFVPTWRGYDMGKGQAPAMERTTRAHSGVSGVQTSGATTTKQGTARLLELGLTPKAKLEFTPSTIIEGRGRSCINGWAYIEREGGSFEAIQALIYGVDPKFANAKMKDEWEVRPVGVTVIGEKDKEEPALICRLVGVSPGKGGGTDDIPFDYPTHDLYHGPHNEWISGKEWLEKTDRGCVTCKRDLSLDDAEDVVWVNDNKAPLCGECCKLWNEDGTMNAGNC